MKIFAITMTCGSDNATIASHLAITKGRGIREARPLGRSGP